MFKSIKLMAYAGEAVMNNKKKEIKKLLSSVFFINL